MSDLMADYHCRKCGDPLSVDEFGETECEACANEREPWECGDFYCEGGE
jgi:uncharacterized Zn finger protein (UPF0148 family)